MPVDRLLRIPDVCERLNHGRTRVYQLLASGQLPSVVIGPRARRVRESDLDAFIAGLNDGGLTERRDGTA
jgi:excisionase family DNA binding protein